MKPIATTHCEIMTASDVVETSLVSDSRDGAQLLKRPSGPCPP